MAITSSSSSRKSSGPVLRSLSPSGRFYSPNQTTNLTSAFASSSSSFSSTSSAFFSHHHSQYYHHDYNNNNHHSHHRSASPTRVNIYSSSPITTPSFRFSIDRSTSPNRSIAVSKQTRAGPIKKTCMCSPTNHPGSFRCALHRNSGSSNNHHHGGGSSLNSLNMRRSAMKNSLVRIGGVEGDWVKRALTALIRPSSHQQKRREGFQARPSRLSIMSKAEDI